MTIEQTRLEYDENLLEMQEIIEAEEIEEELKNKLKEILPLESQSVDNTHNSSGSYKFLMNIENFV